MAVTAHDWPASPPLIHVWDAASVRAKKHTMAAITSCRRRGRGEEGGILREGRAACLKLYASLQLGSKKIPVENPRIFSFQVSPSAAGMLSLIAAGLAFSDTASGFISVRIQKLQYNTLPLSMRFVGRTKKQIFDLRSNWPIIGVLRRLGCENLPSGSSLTRLDGSGSRSPF
jgi:hypothetical protein